jgi:splicing factor 3B subunit 1
MKQNIIGTNNFHKFKKNYINNFYYFQLVDTTVEIANKVGAAEIISRVVDDLKDESEQYRKMVMETIEKIMSNLGSADVDSRLEEQLIDGILYAFQEQTTEVYCFVISHHC